MTGRIQGNNLTAHNVFVLSGNLARRHLDSSQRGMIAARLATMRQVERTDLEPNGATSQTDAGKLLDVGRRTVQRVAKVLDGGIPDLVAQVEQDKLPVSAMPRNRQSAREKFLRYQNPSRRPRGGSCGQSPGQPTPALPAAPAVPALACISHKPARRLLMGRNLHESWAGTWVVLRLAAVSDRRCFSCVSAPPR
jgi:hypothetical protein